MSTSKQIDMDIQTATNDDFYRIQNLIEKFPGITTNLLISNLDLKMKEESLKVLFGRINRYRNTFYDLGPFVEVQDKWFIENVKQLKNIKHLYLFETLLPNYSTILKTCESKLNKL